MKFIWILYWQVVWMIFFVEVGLIIQARIFGLKFGIYVDKPRFVLVEGADVRLKDRMDCASQLVH